MTGNVWKISDLLDDEDILFIQHEFVTYDMAARYYGMTLKVLTKLAWDCGSVYKLNKKVLIRRSIFEAYLRKLQRKGALKEYVNSQEEEK